MKLGLSARKVARLRHERGQKEAQRLREATWDGSFWLLSRWNALPIVERIGHVLEMMAHPSRDAFIPRFCRQYAGPNWVSRMSAFRGGWMNYQSCAGHILQK